MKKLVLVLLALATYATADVYVNGYYRNDGTYVGSHYRSDPNGIVEDNYSYKKSNNYNYGRGW